jgi:hypothetical protein
MKKKLGGFAAVVLLAGAASAILASAVQAGSAASPYVLRGTSITVDEAQGTSRMEGSLIGTWQTTSFAPLFQNESQFAANGMELFTGCHDRNKNTKCETAEKGTLRLTYTFWTTFDPATGALVKGQCVHPIVSGGTGAFKGARGVIFMKDTPTETGVRTVYSGTLLYAGAPAARTTQSHSSSRRSCGG